MNNKLGPVTPAVEIRKEISDHEEWEKAGKPAEGQSYRKVFFFLSGLLFLTFIWAVWNEFVTRRPWVQYQRQFYNLEKTMTQDALQKAREEFENEYRESYDSYQTELKVIEENLKNPEILKIRRNLQKAEIALNEVIQEFQFTKSEADAAYYQYKKALHNDKDFSRTKKNWEKFEAKMAGLNPRIVEMTRKRDELRDEVNKNEERRRELRKEMVQMTQEKERLEWKLNSLRFKTSNIEQIVIQDFERNYFNQPVARVDRCVTCHMGVDRSGFEKAPEPFKTHPKREVLFANHPIERFGCTPCHQGQGRALTVEDAHGHVPFWEQPLLLEEYIEASCIRCHVDEKEIPIAPSSSRGRELFKNLGCHGCHLAEEYEDMDPVGPPLVHLGSKVKADWLVSWIMNPRDYLPDSRMPRFHLTDEEAKAVAAYLLDFKDPEIQDFRFTLPSSSQTMDQVLLTEGKKLLNSSGCITCHDLEGHDAEGEIKVEKIGPNLSKLEKKVEPEWLFTWLKNPNVYRPGTKMPRFRFTDREARALTAYLLKGAESKNLEEDLSFLNDPSMKEKGKRMVQIQGCFGCHLIPGMEEMTRVSEELTEFGAKDVHQLDFGDTKIPQTWEDWAFNKLNDPQIYMTEQIQLKMPNFGLTDEEIGSLVIFLKSMSGEKPPPEFLVSLYPGKNLIEGPFGVINRTYKCLVCHRINGEGTEIGPDLSHEGSKVKREWLARFLKSPHKIRPNEKAQMPDFSLTNSEIETSVNYMKMVLVNDEIFSEIGTIRERGIDEATLREGGRLYQEVYGCVACHRIGNTGGIIGPDLSEAGSRLTGEWTFAYLKNPQAVQGKVSMPHFGMSDRHAKVLAEYLMVQK
jgi:mono/diheme cytochrome c family protein/predicted  nucleic acid-binding Zn-ribbon protein